jgi:hypothetical protein
VERVVFNALVKNAPFLSMAVRLRSNGLIKLIDLTAMHGKELGLISDRFWCVQAQPSGQINEIAASSRFRTENSGKRAIVRYALFVPETRLLPDGFDQQRFESDPFNPTNTARVCVGRAPFLSTYG